MDRSCLVALNEKKNNCLTELHDTVSDQDVKILKVIARTLYFSTWQIFAVHTMLQREIVC